MCFISPYRTIFFAAMLCCLSAEYALADSCSSVIPGAQMGPMPEARSWPWDNACYIAWPGTDSTDYSRNSRLEYERQCKGTPGYLRFEGDYGSNKNVCIFEQPTGSGAGRNTEAQTDSSEHDKSLDWSNADGPDGIFVGVRIPDKDAPAASDYNAAESSIALAEKSYSIGKYYQATGQFGDIKKHFSNKDRNWRTSDPRADRIFNYIECMKWVTDILSTWRSRQIEFTQHFLGPACRHASGRFVADGISRVNALKVAEPIRFDEPEKARAVDSSCLQIKDPTNTGVGCAKGKAWFMTHIGVAKNSDAYCPAGVKFKYVDENGDEIAEAPTTLQTCGGPPTKVEVSP